MSTIKLLEISKKSTTVCKFLSSKAVKFGKFSSINAANSEFFKNARIIR